MYHSFLVPRESKAPPQSPQQPTDLGTPLLTWMVRVSRHPVHDIKGLGHCHLLLSSPHKVWRFHGHCLQAHLSSEAAVLHRGKSTPGLPMITNTIWSMGPQRSPSFLISQSNASGRHVVSCPKLWPALTSTMKSTRMCFNLEKRLPPWFSILSSYVGALCLPRDSCSCMPTSYRLSLL